MCSSTFRKGVGGWVGAVCTFWYECPLVVLACESLHVCTVCIWRCEHARFCVEVYVCAVYKFSFIYSRVCTKREKSLVAPGTQIGVNIAPGFLVGHSTTELSTPLYIQFPEDLVEV